MECFFQGVENGMEMKVHSGIYLIIDPSTEKDSLMSKLRDIVREKIAIIQIWDNFKANEDPLEVINEVVQLCHTKNIPVLINNQWEMLRHTGLDGVHFDSMVENVRQVRRELNRELIIGVTCGNDLSTLKWAEENALDYISFCSILPSSTANSCELVTFETVKSATGTSSLPVFLAGGIKPENLGLLDELEYSGIAVVSGVMNAANPAEAIKQYQQKMKPPIR